MKPEYDEDLVLTNYVWDHFRSLMSTFELQVGSAITWREKSARYENPKTVAKMRKHFGGADDPAVQAALSDGPEAYRRKVRDRILREHTAQVFINRCPKCQRVVRTPKAKQCFWCGHDWHR